MPSKDFNPGGLTGTEAEFPSVMCCPHAQPTMEMHATRLGGLCWRKS